MTTLHNTSAPTSLLRFGALAAVAGLVLQVVAGSLHPGRVPPNDSAAVFLEYAASTTWTGVHIAQFVAGLLVAVALMTLAASLPRDGVGGVLAFVGGLAALLVAAVFAVQMAVDGIALKATIDAWVAAAPADRAAAFLVADSVRAVEKGLAGFFQLLTGTSMTALGFAVAGGRTYPRWLGWFGVAGGLGFLAGGVATAHTGFSSEASGILSPSLILAVVFLVGIAVAMWRRAGRRTPIAATTSLVAGAPA